MADVRSTYKLRQGMLFRKQRNKTEATESFKNLAFKFENTISCPQEKKQSIGTTVIEITDK